MTKNLFATILCLLFAQIINAQSNSLLWEVSGNGLSKPSYIYGTMHVSDKIAFHLTDSFFIAIKSADVIALESNPETWIDNDFGNPDLSNNNNYNLMDNAYYDRSNYTSDFYGSATNIEIPNADTYNGAFADNSWLINGYLYRYDQERTEYEEETYLDLFIFQCGRKLAKDIAALEGEQEVLKLLLKAYEPDDDEDKVEEEKYLAKQRMIEKFEEEGNSIYEQIDEAYRDGNLEKLDSLELITSPSTKFRYYFIEERNVNMMRRMDSILRTGKVVFTGIGAAHLPGKRGALQLLRDMGYTVKPVKGKISGKSIKEKDKIDDIYFTHATGKQFATDSLFSVIVPGKLYQLGGYKTDQFYLYPDMANSAYYSIDRIAHFGGTKQMTDETILADIDKLLFENVPGDIESKTAIKSNTGYPGYDIISKTKRGNYLRIKIFVSPLETIIFKSSGLGEFVLKSKEIQSFFSSIQFAPRSSAQWTTYTPTWGIVSVSTPDNRITDAIAQNESIYTAESAVDVQAADANGFYWFTTYLYNDNDFIETDSFELVRLGTEFAEQFKKSKYEKVSDTPQNIGAYQSLESTFKGTDDYLHIKTAIKGPYYVVMAAFTPSASKPEQYFNSLAFTDFKYTKTFDTYIDTTLDFVVTTIVPKVDTILTIDEVQDASYDYNRNKYKKDDDEEEDLSYLASNKSTVFSSETTPENIFIKQHKYHKFFMKDSVEQFWAKFDSIHVWNSTMRITQKQFVEKAGITTLSFILTDTGSTRGIYKKYILKSDVLFQLITCIDTIGGPSKFVQTFYDSFTPGDSITGPSIFDRSAALFFEQLNSEDSVLRKQAINSASIVDFEDKDAGKIIAFIQSDRYKVLKLSEKEVFISLLSDLEDESIIPFMRQIYLNAGDTSSLQLAVLSGLAEMQTTEALKAFIELLYIETPLAKKNSSLYWLFEDFHDSLELAAQLYPQLLDFAAFPEYQTATYRLLSLIIKNDATKLNLYADKRKQIIAEANAELKRNLVGTQEEAAKTTYGYSYSSNELNFDDLSDLTDNDSYILNSFNGGDYRTSNYNYSKSSYSNYSSNVYYEYVYEDSLFRIRYPWTKTLQDYYSILLTPYFDDVAVKKYFDKIWLCNDAKLKYRTALTLLASNLSVPDSVWTNMQKDRKLRYDVIKNLQKFDATAKIDTAYGNQLQITEGCLYPYAFSDDEDSVKFVTKRFVETSQGAGYIYFYKSKIGRDKTWNLDCIGLQPEDETKFEVEPLFVHYGTVILDDAGLEKQIDEIIKSIELIGRNRVVIDLEGNNYNYNYDY